jgi:hypothetical protein
MKKVVICLAMLTLLAVPAFAGEFCYSWENGGTVLGAYLPDQMVLANSADQARTGTRSLEVREIADSGGGYSTTPQAYVAWVTGLHLGDVVTGTIYAWDPTASGNPSVRIWGHWTTPGGDINSYLGSASGSNTYSSDYWLTPLTYSWTATTEGEGLVIEVRPYNGATGVGTNYVDDLCVTAPATATVWFPEPVVSTETATWGAVKDLYK